MVNHIHSQKQNNKPFHKVLATAFTFGAALVFLQTTGNADTMQNTQYGSNITNVATTNNNNYNAANVYALGNTNAQNSYVSTATTSSNYEIDSSYYSANQNEQNANGQANASQTASPSSSTVSGGGSINTSGLSSVDQQFLSSIKQASIDGWKQYGVLPSVTAAQAIIESAWGQSGLATEGHNLFGIKGSYNGQSITMRTAEYGGGGYYYINDAFRRYPSNYESIVDHGRFLAENSRYSNLLWQKDYQVVTRDLQLDGYATSPTYTTTLNSVIERYNLTAWDQEAFGTNTGWIDTVAADGNNLKISGWHATSDYNTNMHHYIIVLNADNNQELYRTEVSGVYRQDVQDAYGNSTNISGWGGFSLEVPLADLAGANNFQIVSRYTLDNSGNPNGGSDIYFTPVKNNAGCLDNFNVNNNQIYVSGWNANNLSSQYKNHFIILYDVTKNREVGRKLVGNQSSSDVVNGGYSGLDNANNSRFSTTFNITTDMAGDTFEIVSRYSDSSDINNYGHYSDMWFSNKELTLNQKQAWLDTFNESGNKVTVSGWHADDSMAKNGTHTLILYDRTLGREIARTTVVNNDSSDVARSYPQIYGSNKARFSATFTIDPQYENDDLQLISRYSTANGVNDSSEYSDIWFDKHVSR